MSNKPPSINTKSKVLAGVDFCKSFRINGCQVVFILIDDINHIPVLHVFTNIDGERVKSEFQPEIDGERVRGLQERFDFAMSALNETDRASAKRIFKMIRDKYLKTNTPSKPVKVDVTAAYVDTVAHKH